MHKRQSLWRKHHCLSTCLRHRISPTFAAMLSLYRFLYLHQSHRKRANSQLNSPTCYIGFFLFILQDVPFLESATFQGRTKFQKLLNVFLDSLEYIFVSRLALRITKIVHAKIKKTGVTAPTSRSFRSFLVPILRAALCSEE